MLSEKICYQIENCKFIEVLYAVSVDDFFAKEEYDESFVFQGSKNWDMYLSEKPDGVEYSTFNKVYLVSFEDKNKFLNFMKGEDIIDYSLEHSDESGKYFVLFYRDAA